MSRIPPLSAVRVTLLRCLLLSAPTLPTMSKPFLRSKGQSSGCFEDDHKHFQLLWLHLSTLMCLVLNLGLRQWIMGLNVTVLCLLSWNITPFCVPLYFSQCRWIVVLAKHSSKIILWIRSTMLLIFCKVLFIFLDWTLSHLYMSKLKVCI